MTQNDLYILLTVSSIVFSIGAAGLLVAGRTIITMIMSIELMLLSIGINFISFSIYLHNYIGQIFFIFIITVVSAEAAIGLSILMAHYKNKRSITLKDFNEIQGG